MQHLADLDDDALAELYAYPPSEARAVVRANFVTTLDGSSTGEDGLSGSINDEEDARVFSVLRALSDVVLVGAGTIRSEGYGRLRTPARWREARARWGLADHPVLAVVSRTLDLPDQVLDADPQAGALLVVSTLDAEPTRVQRLRERLGHDAVVLGGRGSVDLVAVLEQLAGRGLTQVLTEGGPTLMNDLVRADLLDELCLTMSPVLVGGHGRRMSDGAPLHQRMHLAHAISSAGPLLTRWTRRPPAARGRTA